MAIKTFKTGIHPIGFVRGNEIVVHKKWSGALAGIEGFSHVIVVFWLDRARAPEMKIRPKGLAGVPKVGYLATRTPHRANPIGVSVVRLLARRGARMKVEGLDAWDGTPVLDLKPYTRRDSIRNFKVPSWVRKWDKKETDPLRKYGS